MPSTIKMKILDLILDDGFMPGSTPGRIIGVRKMNKQTPDPSVLKYVLKVNKATEVNCELLGHALVMESELNAWINELERKERTLKEMEMEEKKNER